MTTLPTPKDSAADDVIRRIARNLRRRGYAISLNALPLSITEPLLQRILRLGKENLKRARVGRQRTHRLNAFVRRDHIHWLDPEVVADKRLLNWMERLRRGLNEQLFLGLFDFESHYAHYPPGAFYKRHVDAFRGGTNRVVSTVLYLNRCWSTADGGELVLYRDGSTTSLDRVLPGYGTLVVFLSEAIPHEVRRTNRDRYSVAGWYRVNNSLNQVLDPPT